MNKANISMVAKRAGVSKTTVSRVLNNSDLVKEVTKNRVNQVISELGYQPNELARGLRNNETKTIGVIISNILNPFFTSIVRGIEDVANKFNYNIMLCNTDENSAKEIQYLQTLLGKRVDGLIIASTGTENDYFSMTGGKPVVFFDRKPCGKNLDIFDTVLVQNRKGSKQAVEHLISSGYSKVGIITGSNVSTTGYERLRGYQDAIESHGLKADESLIKLGDFLGHTAYKHAIELMTRTDCDAIFAGNNMILLGVLRAASELNIKFPSDMGLVSFDDMEWMQYCQPQITAVMQPTYLMGTSAMELLLERMMGRRSEPVEIKLDVELIVRKSSQKQ